jgi:MYXO-CTERM domain-containing protein
MQQKVEPKAAEAKRKLIAERAGRIAATNKKIGDVRVSSTLAMSQTQLLDEVWPTYRIRPYYDTGDKQVIDGQTVPVLAPMVPFGFHMSHDGPFYGFSHALQAADPGLVLTKLSDYWYKVTIKSEGAAHLRTIVTAEEKPVPATGQTPPGTVDCKLCEQMCPNCKVKPGPRCNCRLPGAPVQGTIGGMLSILLGLALLWSRRRNKRD